MTRDNDQIKAVEFELCRQGIGALAEPFLSCVFVNLEDAGFFVFGTAGPTWAGDAYKDENAYESGDNPIDRIATSVASDSQDVPAIVAAIRAGLSAYVGRDVSGMINAEKR